MGVLSAEMVRMRLEMRQCVACEMRANLNVGEIQQRFYPVNEENISLSS